MFLPFIFHSYWEVQLLQLPMKSHERWCWKKEEAWTSDLLFSHLWWDLLFLESLVLIDQFESKEKRENTNIYQIHSLPDFSICMCRSITGVTGVGNFCSAYLRLPWGYLATTNGSFSSAGYNLAFLVEQGPGTAELAPFIKPWQFYSFKPIHLRKERLRAPLQRCDALLSVTVPAALTFLTAGEEKISGEALMLAICMWSLGQWVGLQL